jgi:hypothetical protein
LPDVTFEEPVAKEYYELVKYGDQPLYKGCTKHWKLLFMVKLYHSKCLCGKSDKAMTMILDLLRDTFEMVRLLGSFYEMKKTITKLRLDYQKIHACPSIVCYIGVRRMKIGRHAKSVISLDGNRIQKTMMLAHLMIPTQRIRCLQKFCVIFH